MMRLEQVSVSISVASLSDEVFHNHCIFENVLVLIYFPFLCILDDIANVIAVWTGIPASKMLESERDRILHMDEELRDRVVGQDQAVSVITEAIQRSRAGLNDPTKPIASLVFLGPTGELNKY